MRSKAIEDDSFGREVYRHASILPRDRHVQSASLPSAYTSETRLFVRRGTSVLEKALACALGELVAGLSRLSIKTL